MNVKLLKAAKETIAEMLAKIGHQSMDCGYFPGRLKIMFILGVHKGGARDDPSQYRPIALTSHLAKTLEKVVRVRVIEFLESNDLMDP